MPDSFIIFNSTDATEQSVQKEAQKVANHLFCTVATLGQVPIIRYLKGGPSEVVASLLATLIRDHLCNNTKTNVFTGRGSFSTAICQPERPLLILFDRTQDLMTPLKHCWSYNSMIHDLFGIHSNRINLSNSENKKTPNPKLHDLDTNNDYFWIKYAHKPTFEVASLIDEELTDYVAQKNKINQLTGVGDAEELTESFAQEK